MIGRPTNQGFLRLSTKFPITSMPTPVACEQCLESMHSFTGVWLQVLAQTFQPGAGSNVFRLGSIQWPMCFIHVSCWTAHMYGYIWKSISYIHVYIYILSIYIYKIYYIYIYIVNIYIIYILTIYIYNIFYIYIYIDNIYIIYYIYSGWILLISL